MYLTKANEELKGHLEEICNQLEGSLTENERLAGKLNVNYIGSLERQN
jgi:hypothetical protein